MATVTYYFLHITERTKTQLNSEDYSSIPTPTNATIMLKLKKNNLQSLDHGDVHIGGTGANQVGRRTSARVAVVGDSTVTNKDVTLITVSINSLEMEVEYTYVLVTIVCHKYNWLVVVAKEKLKDESLEQK